MLGSVKKIFFMSARVKKQEFMNVSAWIEKKNTPFARDTKKKDEYFFYSYTQHCANLIISPRKERFFLCWYGICENSKIPYQQRKYIAFLWVWAITIIIFIQDIRIALFWTRLVFFVGEGKKIFFFVGEGKKKSFLCWPL